MKEYKTINKNISGCCKKCTRRYKLNDYGYCKECFEEIKKKRLNYY